MADPFVRCAVGATATRDRDDLATVRQELHDQLIDDIGDARTAPVTWTWWPAPRGLSILADAGLTTSGLARYVRTKPGGWLVLATVEFDPDRLTPELRAELEASDG